MLIIISIESIRNIYRSSIVVANTEFILLFVNKVELATTKNWEMLICQSFHCRTLM